VTGGGGVLTHQGAEILWTWVSTTAPTGPMAALFPAPLRFHDLPGEQYVATLAAAVAAEHRLADPYIRPEIPPMLEGRFLMDLTES
jgi:hypothetical protein